MTAITYTHEDIETLKAAWQNALRVPFHPNTQTAFIAYRMALSVYLNWPSLMPSQEDIALLQSTGDSNAGTQEGLVASSIHPVLEQEASILGTSSSTAPNVEAVGGDQTEASPQAGETEGSAAGQALSEKSAYADYLGNRLPGRYRGIVKAWNGQWGKITAPAYGDELYVNRDNFRYANMPLSVGDEVTFCIQEHTGSQPKAILVLKDGYTPERTTYTPAADLVENARQAEQKRKAELAKKTANEKARKQSNDAAFRNLFNGKQGHSS